MSTCLSAFALKPYRLLLREDFGVCLDSSHTASVHEPSKAEYFTCVVLLYKMLEVYFIPIRNHIKAKLRINKLRTQQSNRREHMTETEEALFLSSTPARVGPHRGAGGVRAEDYGHGAWIQGLSAFYIVDRSHHWVWDWLWQRHCEEVRSAFHLFCEDERINIRFESCFS